MKRLFYIIAAFLLLLPSFSRADENSDLAKTIMSGKWINRSDGYVASPTFNPKVDKKEDFDSAKRYKTLSFASDYTFTMDSLKQRYSGKWVLDNGKIVMDFNPKVVTHLNKNMDPNAQTNAYVTTDELLDLGTRELSLNNGKLTWLRCGTVLMQRVG